MIVRVELFLACVDHCVGISSAIFGVSATRLKSLKVGDGLPACQEPITTERAAVDNEVWDDVLQYFEGFVCLFVCFFFVFF